MTIDELGLPREGVGGDWQDSSRLAGIMVTFEYPPNVPMEKYVIQENGKTIYCRHPRERIYDFSRDQTLCLVSGLYFQNLKHLVNLDYVDGKDIFTPANRGHIRRCQGLKASWFQDAWLWFDVWRSQFKSADSESNQLLCQLMVADKKFLKYYLSKNKKWRDQIRNYWGYGAGAWRGEPELALHMIKKLEGYL